MSNLVNILLFVLFVGFVIVLVSHSSRREGLALSADSDTPSSSSSSSSSSSNGIGGNSNAYMKKIESDITKMDDKLAITTNLNNYKSIVEDYSNLITYKMLDTILSTDLQKPQTSLEQLQLLHNASNAVKEVSSVLKNVKA
jgi:hypothetical protein